MLHASMSLRWAERPAQLFEELNLLSPAPLAKELHSSGGSADDDHDRPGAKTAAGFRPDPF